MFIAGSQLGIHSPSMLRNAIHWAAAGLAVALAASVATDANAQAPTQPAARAGIYDGGACLSLSEGRRALQAGSAISLASAVKVARDSTPGQIVDYKICQAESGYGYVLTILNGNGKVVRAWVDALSGKLLSVR